MISRSYRGLGLALAVVGALVLAGCAGGSRTGSEPPAPPVASGPAGAGAPAPGPCTDRVGDPGQLRQALDTASPGDTVCVTADLANTRLVINHGGSPSAPVTVRGSGKTAVNGIEVTAGDVVVDGFTTEEPRAPGVSLKGNNITLRNTTIVHPVGGDFDGIRFWGSGIKIVHNTVTNTTNTGGAHADCMQTFATDEDHPASQDVLIDSNRCERIDNNCLIVEGPDSSAGDGSGDGETRGITFSNNYCDNRAAQAVLGDDVQNMVISGNQIAGRIHHAFALQNNSTNAVVRDNRADKVGYLVGMDSSSEDGYQGPEAGGEP